MTGKFQFHVGVVQTRPHDTETVMMDMSQCEWQADNTQRSAIVSALTAEQASAVEHEGYPLIRPSGI